MIYAENKRAYFDYEILEAYEAGIVLTGFETKAVRSGRMNLAGAHVVVRPSTIRQTHGGERRRTTSPSAVRSSGPNGSGHSGEEAWLLNADVPPYQTGNTPTGYESDRTRKLLLNRKEINELIGKSQQKGLTILPLKVYTKGPRIKIAIGVARGKRQYEKREKIRKRETEREIEQKLKEY